MRARMIAFSGGVILLYCVGTIPPPTYLFGAAALLLLVAWRARGRRVAGLFCCLLLGASWADYQALVRYNGRLPAAVELKPLMAEGYLCSLPAPGAYGAVHFDFCVTRWPQTSLLSQPARIRLTRYHAKPSDIPDQARLVVRLKRPHGEVNPSGFRYETWLFRHGYLATGSVRTIEPGRGHCGPSCHFDEWRRHLVLRFEQRYPHLDQQPLVESLLFGVRARITSSQWQVLQRTGTIHLISISGLHVGLLAALTGWLSRYVWLLLCGQRFPPSWQRRFVVISVLVSSGFYAALAGFSIPTQRALIMVAVGLAAYLSGRRLSLWTAWWTALCLVLLIDPLAPLDLGCWLSFCAVASLLFAFGGRLRPSSSVGSLIVAQIAIGAGLLPVLMAMGLPVASLGFLVNLLAIPWVSLLVMPLLFVAVPLGMTFPFLAGPLSVLMDAVLGLWWQGLSWSSAHSDLLFPVSVTVALGVAATTMMMLWPVSRFYRMVAAITLLIVLTPLLPEWRRNSVVSGVTMRVFDVGEGTSVLLRSGRHAVLYGVGPGSPDGYNAASQVILPSLAALGVRRLDALVMSRADWNHRLDAKLLENGVWVERVISPKATEPELACKAAPAMVLGDMVLTFWAPPRAGDRERSACVTRVETAGGDVMLAGDLSVAGERWRLSRPNRPAPVRILVAGRAGSATGSSLPWVRALEPEWVVFAAGYRNPYHHPAALVVRRYRQAGARILETAKRGSLHFRWKRDHIVVSGTRDQAAFWIEKTQLGAGS
ncbi:DNA internalization-related competence protein ComEC/Rec2 [Mangrovitalea sediminis]|uniref:DNA internalization-related competence protein ComEC/Rec2 n=1 Tax=Mangrovitalea sediminis TaxID=1982043 RepID=UPI001178198E|nr:DNA internalization-related competence protein ComEC/Rec2 [Mangrovitalea sediminis]